MSKDGDHLTDAPASASGAARGRQRENRLRQQRPALPCSKLGRSSSGCCPLSLPGSSTRRFGPRRRVDPPLRQVVGQAPADVACLLEPLDDVLAGVRVPNLLEHALAAVRAAVQDRTQPLCLHRVCVLHNLLIPDPSQHRRLTLQWLEGLRSDRRPRSHPARHEQSVGHGQERGSATCGQRANAAVGQGFDGVSVLGASRQRAGGLLRTGCGGEAPARFVRCTRRQR
jgi:hypothetical protein